MNSYRTRISGVGSYLPSKLMTNQDLEKLVDTSDQWIRERTGIVTRHIAAPDQATSDLAYQAAIAALEDASMRPQDIDMILVATCTADHRTPSTSCLLQNKLGIEKVPCLDINAACSGFVYGVQMADSLIRSGLYKNILLVGAEIITRFTNYKDRETCILFGDAAGAWVMSRADAQDKNIVFSTHLRADGNLSELFLLPGGGSRMPFSQDVLDQNLQFFQMKGREIFKNAVRTMSAVCAEALTFNGMTADQVDWLIPHQANNRILEAVADHFQFPKERVVSIVHEMGNTSAATIPVAFDTAKRDGRIRRGQNILLTAFGAGLTSGSALLRY